MDIQKPLSKIIDATGREITEGKQNMKFEKGKSGNPNGRPKKTKEQVDLEAACRDLTPKALDVVVAIMESGDNERNRFAAAQYILDRGWGKPKQALEHSGKDGEPLNIEVTFI